MFTVQCPLISFPLIKGYLLLSTFLNRLFYSFKLSLNLEFDEGSLYDNPPPEESQKRSRGRPRKNASKSLSSTQSETREKQTLRFRKNMPSSLANQLDKIKVIREKFGRKKCPYKRSIFIAIYL